MIVGSEIKSGCLKEKMKGDRGAKSERRAGGPVVPAKTVLSLTAEFSEVDDTRSINADQGGGWKDGGGCRWGGICSSTELDFRPDGETCCVDLNAEPAGGSGQGPSDSGVREGW